MCDSNFVSLGSCSLRVVGVQLSVQPVALLVNVLSIIVMIFSFCLGRCICGSVRMGIYKREPVRWNGK